MTRLTPKRPVRLVPDAFTAAASFLWVSRSWASRWPMSVRNSAASSQRARATGARWGNLLEEAGGLAGADLLADPAGHQVAHHRMQPAGGLVAQAGQVTMPLGPHLQHGGVVSASTGRLAVERSAATATDKAPFGSFLLVSTARSSRTRAELG